MNFSYSQTGIYQNNWETKMPPDALAPCVIKTSAVVALIMWVKQHHVFNK